MRIVMVGAGGVGGYFGGRIAARGGEVCFVARGAHLQALRKQGLRVVSPRVDMHLPRIEVVAHPAAAGRADLVLIAVKLADTAGAIEAIGPLMGPDSVVASLQNGIDAEDMLVAAFGEARVLGGVARISATIGEPGVIRHVSAGYAGIEIGELDGRDTPRLQAIGAALRADGMELTISRDIRGAIWQKFVFLASLSAATTTSRSGIGRLRADSESRAFIEELIAEAIAVAQAEGVALPENFKAAVLGNIDKMPAEVTASMTHDLLHGKPLELDWLSGAVLRLGRRHGIPTPAHQHSVAILQPHRLGSPA